MRAEAFGHWDGVARARWTGAEDPADRQAWPSSADDVLAGRPWRANCAGLTSTVLDLYARAGAALASLYRVIGTARSGEAHMWGVALDDDGRIWIVGDALAPGIYPAADCAHAAAEHQRMDEVEPDNVWRAGAPYA